MSPPTPTPLPIHSLLNKLYTFFFLIHLPIIFLVDAYPLYPPSLTPPFLTTIHNFYRDTYKDRFFTDDAPAWFWWFVVMEVGGHVPICLAVLGRGGVGGASPSLHLTLLLLALQTLLTTGVCIAEAHSWPELSAAEKSQLDQLYVPYFVFAGLMFGDMYFRVRGALVRGEEGEETKGKVA